MDTSARVYVAGGTTLVGRALLDRLRAAGCRNLVGLPPAEPDLTDGREVADFFARARPEYVFVAAGASAGIRANRDCPADLMLDNLLSGTHLIHASHRHGVRRLLYLASSCAYPREAPQPLRVESLMTGPLEPTNDAYATAKLAGLKLCEAYRRQHGCDFFTVLPANPFGPHDDFDPTTGHVIPALMRRLHLAQRGGEEAVTVWGTGRPRRDFVYAPDLADACLFLMKHYDGDNPINVGSGAERSIAEVARAVADVVGYRGRLVFDADQPDGMPRKVLDATPLFDLGWRPGTDFRVALQETYAWFAARQRKEDTCELPAAV